MASNFSSHCSFVSQHEPQDVSLPHMQFSVAGGLHSTCSSLLQSVTTTRAMLERSYQKGFEISADERAALAVLTSYNASMLSSQLFAIGCNAQDLQTITEYPLLNDQEILKSLETLDVDPVIEQLNGLQKTLSHALRYIRKSLDVLKVELAS